MKLTQEEQIAFDKVKALSKRDPKCLKDVFIAMLEMVAYETYHEAYKNQNNSFTFHIPYLCSIKVEYEDKIKYACNGNKKGEYTEIKMTTIPSESFIAEIEAISAGETTPSERYIKRQIPKVFGDLLEIQDIDIEE